MTKFKKGHTPWNKGLKNWVVGTKAGFQKGNKLGNKFSKGHKLWNSSNSIKNQFKFGEKNHNIPHSEETKKKLRGIKKSNNTKIKISAALQGIQFNEWEGFTTSENDRIRKSIEYIIWRKKVFKRDKFTCQLCKTKGCLLHPHHIKQFAFYPELRFDMDNGITLCKECHFLIHSLMGYSFEKRNIDVRRLKKMENFLKIKNG